VPLTSRKGSETPQRRTSLRTRQSRTYMQLKCDELLAIRHPGGPPGLPGEPSPMLGPPSKKRGGPPYGLATGCSTR
jgi:hypothetical protein